MFEELIVACEDVRDLRSGELVNVEMIDPADGSKSYCIAYRYQGGGPYDSSNWRFDHANHWQSSKRGDFLDRSESDMQTVLPDFPSLLQEVLKFRIG